MINQTMKERKEAYVEVLEILKYMDKKYISKVPVELREFFERNASKEYKFRIDKSLPLEEHNLKEITINILAMLNINYWCEDEKHKQELLKKYRENDLKYQEELRRKYNLDDLFKKKTKNISSIEEEALENVPLIYKESKWYKKTYSVIIAFIKKIFNK